MKTIRVEFDEEVLERFDRHPEVLERGRSAVLQEAASAYLMGADNDNVAELEGWANQGVWPKD